MTLYHNAFRLYDSIFIENKQIYYFLVYCCTFAYYSGWSECLLFCPSLSHFGYGRFFVLLLLYLFNILIFNEE